MTSDTDTAGTDNSGTTIATRTIRVGVAGSELSLARGREIGEQIGRVARGVDIELVVIEQPRDALLALECDIVMHAMGDLPTAPHSGLVIGAIPQRGDARDALCARDGLTLAQLPPGSRVGADSVRRMAQLRAARADIDIVEVRGSVAARLAILDESSPDVGKPGNPVLDAIVLEAASLHRLGRIDVVTEFFELSAWPTDPGQGAVALEVRDADARNVSIIRAMLARLDHRPTRAQVTAERAVSGHLPASITAFGATAITDSGLLLLSATAYRPDGGQQITSAHGVVLDGLSPAESRVAVEALGRTVVNELLRHGVAALASQGSQS